MGIDIFGFLDHFMKLQNQKLAIDNFGFSLVLLINGSNCLQKTKANFRFPT